MLGATLEFERMAIDEQNRDVRDRIDLRADPLLVKRVRRQAERLGMNVSAYIRQAVTLRVEQDEATEVAPRAQRKK